MPIDPTYPGVYVEELPSSVRTILAVSTSVTAFVGHVPRGPVNRPVVLTGFADFQRRFGGLSDDSVLSHTVEHFYRNGGAIAVVVRVALGAVPATAVIDSGAVPALQVTAREPGRWGDLLQVFVDHGPADSVFNLRISAPDGTVEEHRGLSMEPADPRFVEKVVNVSSGLVEVRALSRDLPDPSGTVSKEFPDPFPDLAREITAKLEGAPEEYTFLLYDPAADGVPPATMAQLALLLERKLRRAAPGSQAFTGARVRALGRRLQALPGEPGARLRFTGEGAGDLGLEDRVAPAAYGLTGGADGTPPGARDLIGDPDAKTGIHALRDLDDVNLLCLPDAADLDTGELVEVLAAAQRLCEDKRMVLLVDPPASWTSLDEARTRLSELDSVRSDHAALYFPRIRMTDPLTGLLRTFPPCGAVAGVLARTDTERGVWKAPAGTETRLAGVRELSVPLTDPENGLLNPLGVNCLRSFPIIGPVVWGARTMAGADALASPWKYLPVRRLALMIEESLYRGTKWAVFEPNDERLWAQLRLGVGAFMQTLFRQGAFQGASAREAYFVKCDHETTTQEDVDRGVVNVRVGFAPLKPAEFVILQIEQPAGQVEL